MNKETRNLPDTTYNPKGIIIMKKTISAVLAVITAIVSLFAFASCGNGGKKTVAIIQFGSHASLNNCYDGVIAGLKENGIDLDKYDVKYVNSNFDPSVSQSQAQSFVNGKAEIIIAIATPSAVAAATAAEGEIPVVYCAITDGSVMSNYENVTGSSDVPDFEKQLQLVTAFMGKKDLKIGVLFSTDESSSPFQIANLKKAAEAYQGMEILDSAVSDITTIDTKVNELIASGAECFINILDNTVVGKLESNILPITNEKKEFDVNKRVKSALSYIIYKINDKESGNNLKKALEIWERGVREHNLDDLFTAHEYIHDYDYFAINYPTHYVYDTRADFQGIDDYFGKTEESSKQDASE